jgi:hypothetical protein
VGEATHGSLEGSDRVERPTGERPRGQYCSQDLCGNLLLLGEELASHALFDDDVGVDECYGSVEAGPEGFSHQGGSSCMAPIDAQVGLTE